MSSLKKQGASNLGPTKGPRYHTMKGYVKGRRIEGIKFMSFIKRSGMHPILIYDPS